MKHSFLNFALPSRLAFKKRFNKAVCPHYSKSCNVARSFLFLLAALYWCCYSALGCIMQVRHISYILPGLLMYLSKKEYCFKALAQGLLAERPCLNRKNLQTSPMNRSSALPNAFRTGYFSSQK